MRYQHLVDLCVPCLPRECELCGPSLSPVRILRYHGSSNGLHQVIYLADTAVQKISLGEFSWGNARKTSSLPHQACLLLPAVRCPAETSCQNTLAFYYPLSRCRYHPKACDNRRAASVLSEGGKPGQAVSMWPSTLRKSAKLLTGTLLFRGWSTKTPLRRRVTQVSVGRVLWGCKTLHTAGSPASGLVVGATSPKHSLPRWSSLMGSCCASRRYWRSRHQNVIFLRWQNCHCSQRD